MIDSVTLIMQKGFRITDRSVFDGKYTKQVNRSFTAVSSFTNKNRQYKKQGRYFPVITPSYTNVKHEDGTKEKVETLIIQVSLPKLLYGTNIFDTDFNDYENIITKLVGCLAELKIKVERDAVKLAVVKRADLAKVIRLPDYLGTARQVIRRLSMFDSKPSSDFSLKEYNDSSEGISFKFWNKTQGYVIYDKQSEIVGNGYTLLEQEIIKAVEDGRFQKNVLKFELSLQRKQSLEAVLRRHIPEPKKDYTLYDLLNNKKAIRDILLETFDKVFPSPSIALVTQSEMKENQLERYLAEKQLSTKKKAMLYYLVNMTTKIGVSGMWAQMKREMSASSYDRHKREVSLILTELGEIGGNLPNLITFLRQEHARFAVIRPNGL